MSTLWKALKEQAGLINAPVPITVVESVPDDRPRFAPVPVDPIRHDAQDLVETRGRPRLYATNADRQRAYRERMKEKSK